MDKREQEFKEWHESEGFEEIRLGTNDMVNVSVLKDLWDFLYPYKQRCDMYEQSVKQAD
jgi:hypothetical protein